MSSLVEYKNTKAKLDRRIATIKNDLKEVNISRLSAEERVILANRLFLNKRCRILVEGKIEDFTKFGSTK